MIRSLKIHSLRTFRALDVPRLARVNLVVGANNAGKTTLLEAAEILLLGGAPRSLWRSSMRRGEFIATPSDERPYATEVDVRHLFFGHAPVVGSTVSVEGRDGDRTRRVEFEIVATPASDQQSLPIDGAEVGPSMGIAIKTDRSGSHTVPLSISQAVSIDTRRRWNVAEVDGKPTTFIGTETLETSRLSTLWDNVVLTPEEDKVVEALQIIEPSIERIAFASRETRSPNSLGGIYVKSRDSDVRIPLGSMGDGLKRLLALSLHLALSSGGSLIVDEIDTGLHHSVMEKMWRLILLSASRLNIQVFATTHSLDCVRALAWCCEDMEADPPDVAIHRIERGREATTLYTADELVVASRQHLEIR